ncbi:hypothetical protein EDD15DRAFT_2194496 [Pisolithus albus]|nr:hypothetical protein EDD15DRAFT_2194496 [Pisolithus albus]
MYQETTVALILDAGMKEVSISASMLNRIISQHVTWIFASDYNASQILGLALFGLLSVSGCVCLVAETLVIPRAGILANRLYFRLSDGAQNACDGGSPAPVRRLEVGCLWSSIMSQLSAPQESHSRSDRKQSHREQDAIVPPLRPEFYPWNHLQQFTALGTGMVTDGRPARCRAIPMQLIYHGGALY